MYDKEKMHPATHAVSGIMTKPHQRYISRFCSWMVSMPRTAKIAMMVVVDLVALPFCFLIAMFLRGGDLHLASHFPPASYVFVAVLTIAAFSISDLYRAVIRFIDQRLLSVTGMALAIAILCAYIVMFAINAENFPRSALAIYWFIVFSYVVASRIGVRNFLRNHRAQEIANADTGSDDIGKHDKPVDGQCAARKVFRINREHHDIGA